MLEKKTGRKKKPPLNKRSKRGQFQKKQKPEEKAGSIPSSKKEKEWELNSQDEVFYDSDEKAQEAEKIPLPETGKNKKGKHK